MIFTSPEIQAPELFKFQDMYCHILTSPRLPDLVALFGRWRDEFDLVGAIGG